MRDYRGVSYDRIEDLKSREAISTIDEFLRQLSFGVANLNQGKRADSSGTVITPTLDDYFYLPGRVGGQTGHGGNAASNSLTLASTRHATKGKVYLGTAQQSAYDELNNRLGSGTPSPETKLHVLGNPQSSLTAYTLNANRSIGAEWYGIPSDPATYAYLIDANDATQIFHEDVAIQSSSAQFGTTPTVAAAASYTVTYNAYRTGGGGTGTYTFTIIDSSGVAYLSAALNLADLNTGSPLLQTPVVVSALGGSGTANSIKITITKTNTVGEQFRFSELSFTGAGAGTGSEPALTLFERSAATSLPYSIWRDESDVTVASVSSTGAGQFQNVLLEDPGAGAGTISLIAPTGVTSYALTFPADDGAANELLQTNGTGTLDFVTLSGDATLAGGTLTLVNSGVTPGAYGSATQVPTFTVDAKGRLTLAANMSITYPGGLTGFAVPTADVDVLAEDAGTATTALRSDARLQLSQAIVPTWTGLHSFTPATDIAAIVARGTNQTAGSLTSNLFTGQNAAGLALFQVRNTGRLVLGANDATVTGIVKLDIQAPTGQSVNMVQVVLNAATVWSLGSTGKMVTTTLAPQFNFTGASAATILTSTDTVGNTAWRTLVSGDIPALSYVASVSGTTNRITSSGGLTPAIDISAAYVGQTSITTLGTIGTGTWSATAIGLTKGGTGQITAVAGFDALATVTSTSFGRSFLDRADAAAGRTLLGLGTFATISSLAHSALTGIGTDDHHALVHSHLNAGAGGQLSGAVVATPGLDFASFKAIAMACDSGPIVPTSPAPANGQWFLHTGAGRETLLQYSTTAALWRPIMALGATTVYVNSSTGTDSINSGYEAATPYLTLEFARSRLAPINYGNILMYVLGTHSAAVTFAGIAFAGDYSLTINGFATTGSSTTITGGTIGTATTQATLTGSGAPFNTVVAGSIIKFTSGSNNGLVRVVNGNTGTTITLCGDPLAAAPANLNTFEVYPHTTIISGTMTIGAGQTNVILNDLKFAQAGIPFVSLGYVVTATRCLFNSTASISYYMSFGKRHQLVNCVIKEGASSIATYAEGGDLTLVGTLILCTAGFGTGLGTNTANVVLQGGVVFDGFYVGVFTRAAGVSFLPFTSHTFIKNSVFGITPNNSLIDGVESFVVFPGTYLNMQGLRRVLTQTAALAAVPILLAPPANQYVVSIYAHVGSAMGSTVTFTLRWNDGGAKATTFSLSPGATEQTSLSRSIYVASGDATIEATTPTTGNYSLYGRIIGL